MKTTKWQAMNEDRHRHKNPIYIYISKLIELYLIQTTTITTTARMTKLKSMIE